MIVRSRRAEIRISKFEIRNKSQIRILNFRNAGISAVLLRISCFGFVSDFEIRISDFGVGTQGGEFQVNAIADPPRSSIIECRHDDSGVTLQWRMRHLGLDGHVSGVFLHLWIAVWGAGWLWGVNTLLAGRMGPILLVGFVIWTIGGMQALRAFWRLYRPTRPETIRLTDRQFLYKPGVQRVNTIQLFPWSYVEEPPLGMTIRRAPRRFAVSRGELSEFRLIKGPDRHHLCIDDNEKRYEIGATLDEPDRHWLYWLLEQWRTGEFAVDSADSEAPTI